MAGDAQRRERKVVSVLFCDLVGFTQQAEALDPEDVEAILRPYHARVRAELERHGGTVEKFIGDAVMALFGAPTAHEDDPERAVRAALAIRDFAQEEGLELRIGITTGEALVALDADPSSGQGMAAGDVVNTAARLQSAAPVNEILADATTYRATRTTIAYASSEPVAAKGKAHPVEVWRAVEARSRFGVDVAHEARAELVGRDRELAALRDAFDRAREDRTPQLVTLVGIPGIGKSRLVYELRQIADDDPDIITWRQGRCLAYGDGVTLWALGEIVKAQAGITEQDGAAEVTSKIRRALAETLAEQEVAWIEPHLLALVGLAEEAEVGGDRRNEAFSAWRRFLEALAEARPLILVFEDLHWADETLLDFVDELVDWVSDVPLLVLATARPELLERRPGWAGGKLNATTLALSPLSEEQTSVLLGRLLGRPLLAAEAQRALLERAGGNPLYAEQFTDLYVERGSTDELPVPETLQGIIAARLDALSPPEKALLQEASVMGKVFWTSGLGNAEADVSSTLHGLERKGFVRRQRRSSLEGETEFAFAHALVRDVAYGQIARAERARKHRTAAEWIESLGRPEDHAELIAHHWRSALDLAQVAGGADDELVTKARLSLREAGDRAAALHAHAVAAAQYDDALALWPQDEERPDLLFRRARALFYAYDEERRENALVEARDAFLAAGDDLRAGEAEALLAYVAWDRGHHDEVREHLVRARTLVGDRVSPETARVLAVSARMLSIGEETQSGFELAESALAMAERLGLDELRAHALTTLGMAKNDLDEGSGTADMERARALAREIGSPLEAPILNNLAVQATIEADVARSEELYLESVALAERFGDRGQIRFLRGNLVWIAYMRGRWDEALAEADAFIAECEASPHTQEGIVRMSRGMLLAARGDVAAALDDLERSVELARSRGAASMVIATLSAHAAVLAELGRHEDARALAVEVVPLVREFGSHGALMRLTPTARELGVAEDLLAALTAQPPVRARRWRETLELALRGEFAEAADRAAAGGATTAEALLRHAAGASLLAQGRQEEGQAQIQRALAFFTSVRAAHTVGRIEALLGEAQSASA